MPYQNNTSQMFQQDGVITINKIKYKFIKNNYLFKTQIGRKIEVQMSDFEIKVTKNLSILTYVF